MFDFHEKRKLRGYVYTRYTAAGILLLAGILSLSVFERFVVEREMAARAKETKAQLVELEQQAAALENKVEHLKDDRGVEEELRKRFDAIKPGEQVVVILDDGERGVAVEPEEEEPVEADFFSWLPWR